MSDVTLTKINCKDDVIVDVKKIVSSRIKCPVRRQEVRKQVRYAGGNNFFENFENELGCEIRQNLWRSSVDRDDFFEKRLDKSLFE